MLFKVVATLLIVWLISLVHNYYILPFFFRYACSWLGVYLRFKTRARRELIVERARADAKDQRPKGKRQASGGEDEDWEKVEKHAAGSAKNGGRAGSEWRGMIGFFHPFCNAGGGGERVLWAAIKATQDRWPEAICVVYTGDHDADKESILKRAEERFAIRLNAPNITFIYLSTRHYVLSSTWPHFTLLGQSLGSVILAYDALSLLTPDIFVDTMGYAFAVALCKFLLPSVPTGAYVHYPTISTDMLGSLDQSGQGVNAGQGTGLRGFAKRRYWHLFAKLYGWVGGKIDVVMTNSTWTANHIRSLWGPHRSLVPKRDANAELSDDISVVFPPCPVEEIEAAVPLDAKDTSGRRKELLYIAQFRPEKNHTLVLNAFAHLLANYPPSPQASPSTSRPTEAPVASDDAKPKLILLGSVRDPDDATRVYQLRLLAHELGVKNNVEFVLDAPWSQIETLLQSSWVGINAMWNEHFGIGVVEYQAAGLICVVNRSGGPKYDIVIDQGDGPTGYHASTATEYAAAFREALSLGPEEVLAMRLRARKSAGRFTNEAFSMRWVANMSELISKAAPDVAS